MKRFITNFKPSTNNVTGQIQPIIQTQSQTHGQATRKMTTSKRVRDRSKKKRVHDLEIATEKWKIFSKIHLLLETLRAEPEHVATIKTLDQYRRQINLPQPHNLSDFLRKSPKLFEFYRDRRGTTWVGLSQEAEELVEEEERIIRSNSDKAAEYVTRFLMMTVDKRLRIDKIAHFRRDLGLPVDFKEEWVRSYPDLFRVVRSFEDGVEYLELVGWKREWAVTELEKKVGSVHEEHQHHSPGLLSLAFPLKFPPNYKTLFRYGGKIEHFQKREYLSPYADARGLEAGSKEFDKRAVAVMHELLSFTIEKRLVTDHLTHFRREFITCIKKQKSSGKPITCAKSNTHINSKSNLFSISTNIDDQETEAKAGLRN